MNRSGKKCSGYMTWEFAFCPSAVAKHYYENFYTLSYIDKMWGIMRKEAFPEQIEL